MKIMSLLRRGVVGSGIAVTAICLSGCVSSSYSTAVVERADHLSSAPEWAGITGKLQDKDGKKFFLGFVSMKADVNKSAALHMADQKAFGEPMRSIVTDYIEQSQTFEDLNQENSLSQRLISATKNDQRKLYSMQIVKRYWETVETKKDGESKLELRCYSLAEVPAAEFTEAKAAYITKMNKNPEVKKLMSEIGRKQLDRALADKTVAEEAGE